MSKQVYNDKIGSNRIADPYTLFRQIFRCAQQLVQISRHNSNVVHLTKVKSEERRVKNPIALLVCFTRTTFACGSNS